MSETDAPLPDVTGMKVTVKVDATVTLYDSVGNATDWLKPGVESSMKWNGVPDESQIRSAVTFMRDHVLNPTIDDVLTSVTERTAAMRQGRY